MSRYKIFRSLIAIPAVALGIEYACEGKIAFATINFAVAILPITWLIESLRERPR